ncbi:MAG: hypothetical protein WDW38_010118 [Sanguina aurantia]
MSLYNGPVRAGARGGANQFSWDNVQASADKSYFLGHSTKVTTGRWQQGRDILWYTRDPNQKEAALKEELAAVKQKEEDAMMEALGLKPKVARIEDQPKLGKKELESLLKRGVGGAAGTDTAAAAGSDADRIKGLGFAAPGGSGAVKTQDTLPGSALFANGPGNASAPASGRQSGASQALPPPPSVDPAKLRKVLHAQRKEDKAAKKASKKAKKAAKKAKKEGKGKKESRDAQQAAAGLSSPSGSESSGEEDRSPERRAHPPPSMHTGPSDGRAGGGDTHSRDDRDHYQQQQQQQHRAGRQDDREAQRESRGREDAPGAKRQRSDGGGGGREGGEHQRQQQEQRQPRDSSSRRDGQHGRGDDATLDRDPARGGERVGTGRRHEEGSERSRGH